MTFGEILQVAQLLAILGGFGATIAINRNDTKWVIKSLEEHKEEDGRRFDRLEDRLDNFS